MTRKTRKKVGGSKAKWQRKIAGLALDKGRTGAYRRGFIIGAGVITTLSLVQVAAIGGGGSPLCGFVFLPGVITGAIAYFACGGTTGWFGFSGSGSTAGILYWIPWVVGFATNAVVFGWIGGVIARGRYAVACMRGKRPDPAAPTCSRCGAEDGIEGWMDRTIDYACCASCGCDLRGNSGGRCPECNALVDSDEEG